MAERQAPELSVCDWRVAVVKWQALVSSASSSAEWWALEVSGRHRQVSAAKQGALEFGGCLWQLAAVK